MSLFKKVLEKLKSFNCIQQQCGAVFVLTALLLPIIFGFMGIAYDVGNLYMHKARLQNVADAAALAGGRAFLQSQKKTAQEGTKDTVDTSAGNGRSEETYTIGGSKTRGGNHPDADTAADNYIYKNIVNLGNIITADKYSHYALTSSAESAKIFYRVGLAEEVPLYFLPVILGENRRQQIVRAGAIALVQEGQVSSTTPTDVTFSIFDNLFTYREVFDAGQHTENNIVNSGYNGNIVHTYGDGKGYSGEMFYGMTHSNNNGFSWHTYIDKNAGIIDSNIQDPFVDTSYQTTEYMNALFKKLDRPHVDYTGDFSSLTLDHINKCNTTENQEKYLSEVFVTDCNGGYPVYKGQNRGVPYIYKDGKCYAYDEENNDFVYFNGYPVFYKKSSILFIEAYRPYYNNGNRDILIEFQGWNTFFDVVLNNVRNDDLTQRNESTKYRKPIVSNIFHIKSTKDNLDININGRINNTIGNQTYSDDTPVYIFIEDTVGKIQLHIENNVRPLIIIYKGSKNIELEKAGNCKASIYAPNATFPKMHPNGSFTGSIIAKSIQMQESGDKTTWIQDNFLEGKHGYTDQDVAKVTAGVAARVQAEYAKLEESNKKNEILKAFADDLGITVAEMNSDNWYNLQSYETKKKLYAKWKDLYKKEEYADFKDLLWPWNGHFNLDTEDIDMPEVLRLINFRTEFTNTENGGIKNPFIDLSL